MCFIEQRTRNSTREFPFAIGCVPPLTGRLIHCLESQNFDASKTSPPVVVMMRLSSGFVSSSSPMVIGGARQTVPCSDQCDDMIDISA